MNQSQELEREEVLTKEPVFESFEQEQQLFNASKQEIYEIKNNTEEKLANKIKSESNIKYKKDSNGELDLDFLDIPAFLRKQAD